VGEPIQSPAQRYAASRKRAAVPGLADFESGYPFGLDEFQREACEALERGSGVLVAAPTGAGKTVVGEFAVHLALRTGRKCFYTTPIKALSNQKFHDLVERFGADRIGLLTGDQTIRGEADVVVMTTEVLRNMLYAESTTLDGLGFVVMDEVHYLSDRARGAVWEEVIIHLDPDVRLVSLSATVSNAEEFGAWLQDVRGNTHIVVSEHRPVPLWQHVMVGSRIYDLFAEPPAPSDAVNPTLVRLARDDARFGSADPRRRGPGDRGFRGRGPHSPPGRPRTTTPSRPDVIAQLDAEGMLPAITFVFSRAGCEVAVRQCLRSGLRLINDEERAEVRRIVAERTEAVPKADRAVLGYDEWVDGLERGIAAHHAGLLPLFKEVVEELFTLSLVRAVFATETLALGINMPARTVVLEQLTKWNGETHADVTAGEYTQLTGRAGRRGIDVEGHAVVLWRPGFEPRQVAGLAGTRTYPLRSSFRPSYNMAINLVGSVGRGPARDLLEKSFAQFQANRAVAGLSRQIQKADAALAGYLEAAHCDRGDVAEYDRIRVALSAREANIARDRAAARRGDALAALDALRPGDVVHVARGRRAGVAVVLAAANNSGGPTVLDADRHVRRLTPSEVAVSPELLGRVRIPKSFRARSPQARRDLISTLRAQGHLDHTPTRTKAATDMPAGMDDEVTRLRAELRAHPVHACPDRAEHLRWLTKTGALRMERDALQRRVRDQTGTIARTFDRVCGVLDDLGYLQGDRVQASGVPLAKIYNEADLVVVECLRRNVWSGLDAPSLAALATALVYEARRDDAPIERPPGSIRDALLATDRVYGELADTEAHHRLSTLRAPDPGLSAAMFRWASGEDLDAVFAGTEILPGDFVRWAKQTIDLLGQITAIAEPALASTARAAADSVNRGVVGYA
jgi:ATP-dependent RNA helicase HelY